jgi:hypothetical protein
MVSLPGWLASSTQASRMLVQDDGVLAWAADTIVQTAPMILV